MKNPILNLSTSRAALTVGIAFITSVIFVTLVDDFLLSNFVVPGDTEQLSRDIDANRRLFGWATVGYLLVLVLDTIIGLALYVVLKPANKNRALITATLRIFYAAILAMGILALAFQIIDVYSYATVKSIGYAFFALHILALGFSVFKSVYLPSSIGIVLMLASFTYITFFVDFHLSESMMVLIMLIMAATELSISIWLIIKRNTLPRDNCY